MILRTNIMELPTTITRHYALLRVMSYLTMPFKDEQGSRKVFAKDGPLKARIGVLIHSENEAIRKS